MKENFKILQKFFKNPLNQPELGKEFLCLKVPPHVACPSDSSWGSLLLPGITKYILVLETIEKKLNTQLLGFSRDL